MSPLIYLQTFVVEVIQFRNAFDAQGPAVPGIPPAEAVSRLQDFQQRYLLYDSKRKTLDSVSKLFGIICKPFPELDKTGEVSRKRKKFEHVMFYQQLYIVKVIFLHIYDDFCEL